MKKYIVEFIGTFFLVMAYLFSITAKSNGVPFSPFVIGGVYIACVYAGAHISGAHFNPVVSISAFIKGSFTGSDLFYYIIVQSTAAVMAALVSSFLLHASAMYDIDSIKLDKLPVIISEFLGAFLLVFTYLNTTSTLTNRGNSFYGMAVGFGLMAITTMFQGTSGGLVNPIVAVAYGVTGHLHYSDIWMYVLGSVFGGALATTVFVTVYGRE